MHLSETLRAAVRTSRARQYELAHHIGVHPSTLSAWVNGIFPVHPNDPRVLKLAKFLGVPPDRVFDDTATEARSTRR